VELVGPLDDLDGFYRSLDAVLVPMAFSTGLKIKAAEALALDLPVLAHAHAFEGYRVHHPTQALSSFGDLARACVELAYAPEGLAALRAAAAATQRVTEAAVEAGFAATARALERYRPGILLLVGTSPLAGAWLAANLPFYRAVGEVRVARAGTTPGATDLDPSIPPERVDCLAAGDHAVLQRLVDAAELVVVADAPSEAVAGVDWCGVDVHLVAGLAAFDRPEGTLERMARHLRVARSFVLLAVERVTAAQAAAAALALKTVPTALFGDSPPEALRPSSPEVGPSRLVVLATPRERGRARRLLTRLERVLPWVEARLACPALFNGRESGLASTARWLLDEERSARVVAIDLAPNALAHAALREVLRRQGRSVVPMPAVPGSAPLAVLAHLLQVGPMEPAPSYRDCGFGWAWRHLARRKRDGFAGESSNPSGSCRRK
jgi:hypothetical protein